ncbi:MAG: hypothetical protein QM800_07220 [Paludibacter sp.]
MANDLVVFINTLKEIKFSLVGVVGIMLLFVGLSSVNAAQRYAVATGNWNAAIWAATAGGAAGSAATPTASDDVTINDSRNVTVNVPANCNSLTISDGGNITYVTISGTNSLTITNGITIGIGTGNGDNKYINVAAGTLSCASIIMNDPGNNNRDSYVSISTGTATVTGNITMNGANGRNQMVFAGAGTLNVGGTVTGGTISNLSGGYTALTRGTVNYNGAGQTVGNYNYFNLTLSGSGTKTMQTGTTTIAGSLVSSGTSFTTLVVDLGIAGDMNIGTGSNLDLSTYRANRASAGGTLTVAGTLMLGGTSGGQSGSNFPTNFSTINLTGGTVNYDNAAGGQTIYAVPAYNTLTLGNTSGTQTAGGNLTATTLNNNTNAAEILNMSTYTLNATTINNSGTIRTQNTSATPIPTGRTWGGTVNYDAATGAQSVVAGTYTTLTLGNTSGTQTAGGNLTVTTLNNTNAAAILNMGTYALAATNVTNAGTIRTQNTAATPIPAGKTWGGTVLFDGTTGAQTIPVSTFNNLSVNNSGGATLSGAAGVTGTLTLTSGVLTTTGANLLSVTNTSTSAISGGSITAYINGPVKWTLPASLVSGSMYTFPVGKATYLPFSLVNPTTGTGTVTAQVEAFSAGSGGTYDATLLGLSSSEYWSLVTSGNFTNSSVSLTKQTAVSPSNVIAGSTAVGGAYTSLGGTIGTYAITSSNPISTRRFFAFGQSVPIITASVTTLSGFTYPQGTGPSTQQSFTVNGNFLTNNIVVTPPTNYEISLTSGNGFQSTSLSLPVSNGSVSTTTIYVRLIAGLAMGTYNSEIVSLTSSGAVEKTVTCSGSVTTAPAVLASPSSRTGFVYTYNSSTTNAQSFAVSGSNLVGNVIVTPPSDYEISTGTTYQSTPITLTPAGGTLSSTTINVRMKLGLGVGSHVQNVVVSSTGATSQNVLCSGTVNPAATIYNDNSILSGFVYATGAGPSGAQTFKVSGTNLTDPIVLTPQANYEISSDGSVYYSTTTSTKSISIAPSGGTVNSTTIYVRLKAGLAVGSYNLVSILLTSTGAITKSVSCSGSVVSGAALTTSKTALTAFGYLYANGPSSEQSFSVGGAALGSNNLLVTPSASYEISTGSGASFVATSTITLAPSGGKITPTTIYVRLKAGLGTVGVTQTFGPENIVVSASGATSINVACSGKVFASPLISASATGTPSCPNSTINLISTGADIQTRYWQGPNNFYSTEQSPVLATNNSTPAMSGTYTVTGNVLVGGNLVVNGDFESGNTSFGSGYGYVTPSAAALQPEALYTIATTPQSVHGSFTANGDHTDSPGIMQMVVNGSPTAGVVVWSQSVPVIPGATYQFTYWEQTANVTAPVNPSQLQLYVNGVAAGPVYTANSTYGVWTQFLYNASAGSNTVLNLELVNQNTVANGNDFALDDIVFQQILSANASVDILVNSNLPASVSIVATSTNVVQGATVSFTATPTNGGDTPTYQWKVNGSNAGTNSPLFSYVPANGDLVTCTMTSSLGCSGSGTSNTVTMTVTQPANYWVGTNGTDWGTASNWSVGIPAPGENVIYASTTNSYGSNAINDLVLDQNRTIGSLINATTRRLVIPANKGLTVNNTVTTDNNPDRIYIHCDSLTANGSLIFHNASTAPVYATVEMYSKASWNLNNPVNNKYLWQYFGIPLQSVVAEPTFNGSYVRKWYETGTDITNHWVLLNNASVLMPFYGYELCQASPKVFYFKGALVNSDFNSGQLAYTYSALFPGQHVFANPYTTAIDIRQLIFGSETEASVYLYNTGTYTNWTSGGQSTSGVNPGKYVTASKNLAGAGGIPRQVPSMGSMLVKALSNSSQATFGITYNSVAMFNTDLQRISAEGKVSASGKKYTKIDVSSTSGGDCMWIFSEPNCKRNFDNGWDGVKMLGSSLSPELFALEPDGNYQIDVVDDMNNTDLAFQAGTAVEYTLTFTHENVSDYYPGVYLLDKAENKIVNVTVSGSQYKFLATSTPKPVDRFRLVTRYYYKDEQEKDSEVKIFSSNGMIFVHNFSSRVGNAMIFDISGHFLKKVSFSPNGVSILNAGLTPGAYIVKCLTETEDVTNRIIVR